MRSRKNICVTCFLFCFWFVCCYFFPFFFLESNHSYIHPILCIYLYACVSVYDCASLFWKIYSWTHKWQGRAHSIMVKNYLIRSPIDVPHLATYSQNRIKCNSALRIYTTFDFVKIFVRFFLLWKKKNTK